MRDIEVFRQSLDADTREIVDVLRGLISAAHAGLSESIKWNAPSFALGKDDRITLGIERKGGVRVVLHRGAKPKAVQDFTFADPTRLVKWPATDRGVLTFKTVREIVLHQEALTDLFRRWVDATA